MLKSKVLVGLVIICYILYTVFEFSGNEMNAIIFHSSIVPLITIIYILSIKRKDLFFLLFLVFFSLSNIYDTVSYIIAVNNFADIYYISYYLANSLYIISYIFLIIKLIKSIDFKYVLKFLKIYVVVLTILNFYLMYVLHSIIDPNLVFQNDYYLEVTYNLVILLLLSFSLLNYIYKDNKKSLYLLLGALLIVFSEVIDVAYFYISNRSIFFFISTSLTVIAFYFFYQQSKIPNDYDNDDESFIFID